MTTALATRTTFAGLATLLGLGLATLPAQADSISWANDVSGTWHSPVFWSPSQIPGPGDTATVSMPGQSYDVHLDGTVTVDYLSLSTAAAIFHSNGWHLTIELAIVREACGGRQRRTACLAGFAGEAWHPHLGLDPADRQRCNGPEGRECGRHALSGP